MDRRDGSIEVGLRRLGVEVAKLTGESKTGAVRTALRERLSRLRLAQSRGGRGQRIHAVLEGQVWPSLRTGVRGSVVTQEQEDAILGYGPDGT